MGGCAAPNCSNHSRKGTKMVRFPREASRRKRWIINCRRLNWEPGSSAQLCIKHFEPSQFEQNSEKKLRKDAIPTIFAVPNPPKPLTDKRRKKENMERETNVAVNKENTENSGIQLLVQTIKDLEEENKRLKNKMAERESSLAKFLSLEQISALSAEPPAWSEEAIINGVKLRIAVGRHGYNYLRSIGYPTPSMSTLNRRIQSLKLPFRFKELCTEGSFDLLVDDERTENN